MLGIVKQNNRLRGDMISGAQVRAARAFLRWSASELAKRAKLALSTVQAIETAEGSPAARGGLEWRAAARNESITAIHDVLVRAGITFLPDDGSGVGVRSKGKTVRLEKGKR
jgi:transcriptional regulator with XRE-family HTH domain